MSATNRAHEEDVDDLDDIVDEFDEGTSNPVLPSPPLTVNEASLATATQPQTQSSSSQATNKDAEGMSEDLVRELAENMEKLMRELSGGAGEGSNGEDPGEAQKRAEAWEKMLVDGMNGSGSDPDHRAKGDTEAGKGASNPEDAFQASILQAMEKLRSSDTSLNSDAASSATQSNDPLEAILSQLTSGLDGTGDDNDELQDMLETMMQQLMSKEVLYEPLEELNDKFPTYMKENDSKLSAEDKERYQNQMTRVSQIVATFEDPRYKEEDQEYGAKIVTLMNEMQSFGSPPSEIMGALPPGLDFNADGSPKIPDNCIIA